VGTVRRHGGHTVVAQGGLGGQQRGQGPRPCNREGAIRDRRQTDRHIHTLHTHTVTNTPSLYYTMMQFCATVIVLMYRSSDFARKLREVSCYLAIFLHIKDTRGWSVVAPQRQYCSWFYCWTHINKYNNSHARSRCGPGNAYFISIRQVLLFHQSVVKV